MAGTDYGFKAKDRAKVSAENREAFIQQVNSQYEQKQEAARTKSDTDLLSGVNAGKVTNNQNAIRSGTTTKPTRTVGKESTTPLKSAGSKGNTAAATWENGKGPNPKAALAAQAEKANQRRKANISRLGKDSTIGRDLGYTRDRDLTAATITPAQRLNSLANNINQSEKQLTEWGLQLNRLQAAAQNGTSGAASKYNALAEKYNATFEQYVADIEAYNKLYNGAYRDSSVRGKYAQREYMQQRQANRDLGARRSYQQRLMEEELSAPKMQTLGKENERIVMQTPKRAEHILGAAYNTYMGNIKSQIGAWYANTNPEGKTISGLNSEIANTEQQQAYRRYWTNDLLSSGREQTKKGQMQTTLAEQGLGAFGTFLVDSSIVGIQMLADMGIATVTGGSMLIPMFVRSMGGGYLTAEEMGYGGDAALAYGIGVGAVEALSEKMFSVFSIANRFAKGAVNKEMSERIIDRLVKNMANTPEGKATLSRMFTLLFSSGTEGLEEVAAGIMEPLVRKLTLDHDIKALKEIDWTSALYEGLVGAFMGGIGGAIELPNTRGAYWKYYKEGLDEGIQRYEEAVKKHGLESKEAMKAAKEIWTAGNENLNAVVGTRDGRPVTIHQLAAAEAATRYGRTDAEGNQVQGPRLADSLNLNNYLEREENARKEAENQRLEAARREEAARLEAEEKARVATEKPAQTATEGETVRLDTARSAQNRTDVNNVTPAPAIGQPAAAPTTQGIPEEEMTQEEKDELQYGSGAVEDLGKYSGLAQRMGQPLARAGQGGEFSAAQKTSQGAAETSRGVAEQGEYTNIKGGVSNDQLYDGSSQRDAGERGGEGPESLGGTAAGSEGGPVPAQRGSDGGAAEAAGGIPRVRKNESQRSKIKKRQSNGAVLEKTSGAAQGIEQTDDRTTMQIYTDEMVEADAELAEIKDELEAQGFDVHFHLGPIGVEGGREAAGAHQGNEVWIRVDHPKWTAAQIAKHEYLHGKIHRNKELLTELLTKLVSDGNFARLSRISTRYQESMMLTAEGDNENATLILEEMVCDLYAGMKEFASEDEDARSLHEMIQEEVNSRQAEGELETRGPPEKKAKFSLEDAKIPTREELDAKPPLPVIDVRSEKSIPGEQKAQRDDITQVVEEMGLLDRPYLNEDTKTLFFIVKKGVTHSFKNWGLDNISAIEHLPDLLRTAVLTHKEPTEKSPRDNSTGMYTFFAAAYCTRGGIRPVKIKVFEYYSNGQDLPKPVKAYFDEYGAERTYTKVHDNKILLVEGIEKEEASSSAAAPGAEIIPETVDHPSAPPTISVKELLDLVKGDAAKYVPQYGQRKNPDVRFSMDEPVEEQGGLVALHNLNADKLSKALDLGGFPMPSIAVTKADIPHTNFGDITLVMDRSTVDPQADRRNKVYSADAWTPTFPQTEYEVNEDVAGRLRDKFYELESRYGRQMVDELYRYGNTLEESLNRYGGVEGILDRERDNDRMKLVYLLDTGKEVPEPTIKETVSRMNDRDIIKCDVLIKALGEDTLKELAVRDGEKVGDARRRWWADHGEEMERAYEEYLRLPELNFSEDEIARIQNWMSKAEYIKEAVEARNYLTRGPEKVTEEQDYSARDKAIADVDQADYEAWLEDLFAGAVKDSGIRNSKDIFTPSGNRRSFKATHYPVTLDNIARAMAEENGGNSKNTSGFHGTKTLRAGTSYKFRSIPQMHKLEGRLRHLTEEEALEISRALDGRLMELIDRIDKRRTYGSSESNPFIRMDSIGETLEEIAETGSWGTAQVKRIFAKYSYDLSEDICQDVTDLLTDINNMPVNIFEAKPQRAVRFDEVRAAIVPDSTEPALIDRLREAGVEDVRTYPKGDNDSRLAEVNAVPNVRFAMDEEEPTDKEGDLADQLRKAQRQAAYWEKQAKRTEHPTLREKDLEKLTKDLLKGYESKADRAEMTSRIKELGEYILNGGPDLVWDEVQTRAGQIAGDILDQSERVDDHMWRETAGLRQYLRTTRIKLDPDLKESKGFFPEGYNNFRKKYYGRLLLANDGQSVDSVYTEAAGLWPGLLPDPEEVYSEGEALNNLVALLDSAPPRRYNPYEEGENGTDMEAARELLTNDIIDGLLSENVRQVPPTVADRMAAEAARREAAPAIREEARRERTDEAVDQLEAESGEARHSVPTTAAELEAAAAKAKQAKRQMQKIVRSLRLNEKESKLVDSLLSGAITLDELPTGIDRRGVERAYRAKVAYRDAAAPVEEYNRQHRESNINQAEELIKDSDEWKDKKNFFAYSRETGRRIFQDLTKDTAQANALTRTYIDPIREHEAEKNRMVNRYNERIKALQIETRVRSGNKVSEAYAVQYIGELEFIRDWLEQLPEGETRGDVTYQEAMTLLHEFWEENPNLDQARIHAAVAEFRSIYDEIFAMVNEARVLNGYAPIDYRKGYFPHFTSDTGDNIIESLARGMGLGVEVTELPTSIAGTTHLFRPGIQWSGHMLSRTGNKTDYNVLEGWDRYIPAVANIIYHTEDIQRLRALETAIRHKYSDATVRDEIDATRRSKDLTSAEINTKLDELFKRDTTQLNYFVQWLREYTNQLAGKKAELDRNVEKFIGRKFYRRIQQVENRVAANMLGGNISSAMTNFVPLFQAWANVRTSSMMRAMWDTGVAAIRHDGFRDGSDFLINRRGYDAMYQTLYGKTKNALFMPFNIVDDFVSETIVRARYYDELHNNPELPPEVALSMADTFAGSVLADRAIGELPVIFNSKNPLVKVFTMFQVEVNNDLSHLLKDIPREAKQKGMAALCMSILKYMLGVYMFNDLFEWLFGRRVSLDPLDMLNDLVGDATGHELPNMFESAALIAKGEWDGWEEFENGKGGNFLSDLVADMKEWADDLPFISGLLGGGRFPIQAMLPDEGAVKAGWEATRDILKGEEDQENPNEYDLSKMYKAVRNPLTYWAMPAFGGQLRKIAEGIHAYTQHGSYSQTKQGKVLQYPILDYRDLVKAMVFGKTTTRYGKEWVKSDFDSLTAPQTQAYINLVAGGSDPQLVYEILHDLKGTDRTAAEKAYSLATAKLEDGERVELFGALDRSGEADKFADLMSAGLSFRQCADVLDEWTPLKAKADLTAEGDEGKPERTRLATQFAGWLDEEGYTDEQKKVILDNYKLGASPIRYDWLVRDGISNNGALELAMDWAELTPEAGKNSVSANQKIDAVADAGYLTEKEKHIAVRSLLSDDVRQEDGGSRQTDYDKYVKGYGITVEVYNQYLKVTTGVKGYDRDGDGKTDSGSKRDALFAAIDTLPLQPGQKTALALYQGDYSESSIRKNAPWLR